MKNNAEVVVFTNRDGNRLFGTFHTSSSQNSRKPVIVLLSPGVKMRVGPHRLYNRMTRTFIELGFSVFKFDFTGLGDSEGELQRDFLSEVYNDTESGFFVSDGIDALDWLQEHKGVDQFIVAGLCGGAITGILLAKVDNRVKGLISLGMTVTLAAGPQDRTKFASQSELRALRQGYFRKAFDPKSWLRLLTFRSDFASIFRSVKQLFSRRVSQSATVDQVDSAGLKNGSNANPLFPPAFFTMAESGRRILLIFSESDRLYWDYQEKFEQPYSEKLEHLSDSFETILISGANHVFSFREWEQEMLGHVSDWLLINYPTPERIET